MKKILIVTGIISTTLLLCGCSSNRTVIKDKDIVVKVPEVKAELEGEIKAPAPEIKYSIEDFFSTLPESTYIEGTSTLVDSTGHVSKASVRMYPNRKKDPETGKPKPTFELNVKQSDIHVSHTDTTHFVEQKESSPLWPYLALAVSAAVLFLMFRKR
ncbi:MAG TPA: hypothetical protein VHO03_05885 [Ignavibacteriales bacterium]|nr:hypothetical protein [Ignavibacteriales bacterium]